MMPLAANLPRRYPGLKPFERTQSAVFYGRKDDVQRLSNQIEREQLVVLFAKSGIGKTSLLQAGVGPELEHEGYVPIFLRADKTDLTLVARYGDILAQHPQMGGINTTGERPGQPQTLWERMKRFEFDFNGLPATPILVFDQFEEIFTLGHSLQSRSQFLSELADLCNGPMPESLRSNLAARYEAGETGLTSEVMHWWEEPPEIRVVIAIRSDFLHLLDEISPIIPGILKSRYQLQPLNRLQAQSAIEAPANAPGGPYASPRFRYNTAAMDGILDFLAGRQTVAPAQASTDLALLKKEDEIESFNLQILCQFVEEKIIEQEQPEGFEVTPLFYGELEGLGREIREFYQNQIYSLPENYTRKTTLPVADPEGFRATARRLIEESLVTPNGRRCSMVDDHLMSSYAGVNQDFLDVLVDSRLLRKDNRLDDFYYEISHDTLLPAVVESRDRRRLIEAADREKAALENQLKAEALRRTEMAAELKSFREKRRLARMVSITSFVSLLVTLGFFIWFMISWIKATRQELIQADKNVYTEQYAAAIEGYAAIEGRDLKFWVLKNIRPHKDVSLQRDTAIVLQRLYASIVDSSLTQGDQYYFADDYKNALRYYHRALDTLAVYKAQNDLFKTRNGVHRVDPAKITEKKTTLDQRAGSALKTLTSQFNLLQRDVETFEEAGAWNLALHNLLKMQKLLPERVEELNQLKGDLRLTDRPDVYVRKEIARCRQLRGM